MRTDTVIDYNDALPWRLPERLWYRSHKPSRPSSREITLRASTRVRRNCEWQVVSLCDSRSSNNNNSPRRLQHARVQHSSSGSCRQGRRTLLAVWHWRYLGVLVDVWFGVGSCRSCCRRGGSLVLFQRPELQSGWWLLWSGRHRWCRQRRRQRSLGSRYRLSRCHAQSVQEPLHRTLMVLQQWVQRNHVGLLHRSHMMSGGIDRYKYEGGNSNLVSEQDAVGSALKDLRQQYQVAKSFGVWRSFAIYQWCGQYNRIQR